MIVQSNSKNIVVELSNFSLFFTQRYYVPFKANNEYQRTLIFMMKDLWKNGCFWYQRIPHASFQLFILVNRI